LPRKDPHSIENEPHMQPWVFRGDPSEAKATKRVDREEASAHADDRIQHSVWDEPGLSRDLSGEPDEHAFQYSSWLKVRTQQTSWAFTWLVTFVVACLSGPAAIIGALFSQTENLWFGPLLAILIAPITEELLKAMGALLIVEKRPFLFKSKAQILICIVAGALGFAAIENVFYLRASTFDFTQTIVIWRWTVCVLLHTSCSAIAAVGIMKMWEETTTLGKPPQLSITHAYLRNAMIVHGVYNALATFLPIVAIVGTFVRMILNG